MRKKSWVLAKGWELGLQRAGTQTGVMTCSVRHYWLQPVMSGSSGSEVLNGVPLMRHVELGMGTMLEEPQASEPGPTWTHQRFGLIAWDKHIILARADKI